MAQDSAAFNWQVRSRKLADGRFELAFSNSTSNGWQLYGPNQLLDDVPTTQLVFADSAIQQTASFQDSGSARTIQSEIFEIPVRIFDAPSTWKKTVTNQGRVPASLQGKLLFSYGKGDEFYQGEQDFSIALQGGVAAQTRILIPSIDTTKPLRDCGDDAASGKSLFSIFLLGLVGGLIALVTPCVFPLIPLTVSFFTKKSGSRRKGISNALLYGFCIFGIYALLSLPFHLLDKTDPEILNNISTSVSLNITFFVVFLVFAFSFFGYYEIGLPSSFANRVDSKSGIGDFAGIFFMALALALVSFSTRCFQAFSSCASRSNVL